MTTDSMKGESRVLIARQFHRLSLRHHMSLAEIPAGCVGGRGFLDLFAMPPVLGDAFSPACGVSVIFLLSYLLLAPLISQLSQLQIASGITLIAALPGFGISQSVA
uniref:hypothetical protein n=1 Tax=Castellaniella defragrans TaxID=75697 RepID=UPI00333E7FAF